MIISHNWLSTYLPQPVSAEKCATILTSIGLEVEGITQLGISEEKLKGLVVGEVVSCEKHPNADALKLTKVNTGGGEELSIVCGAPNVALGQKVVVATVGTELHPTNGEPFKIKKAKIRGEESFGMICAADEIGVGDDHAGIMILPAEAQAGDNVAKYLTIQNPDTIFEIGLTPNRTDAMSHYGVARDICAWISHHENREFRPVFPENVLQLSGRSPITVSIEDKIACMRYSGVLIEGVKVTDSTEWLKERLITIGLKPVNNIVDITNFILHETGQPLHAFDADKISGNSIIVKTMPGGTLFSTLDEKERKLTESDLMICDAEKPLCIAGIYGGVNSGVTSATTSLFLESACFAPESIRKTSMHHGLRTDAATRFEKGTDISRTVEVLLHAAQLIMKEAGGKLSEGLTDIYPEPKEKKQIELQWKYILKLSGKSYAENAVKNILTNLGYEVKEEKGEGIVWLVPHYKPNIHVAADLVQEIMRIDGLDNISIPAGIFITPSIEKNKLHQKLKAKAANSLSYSGFNEIFTNSLTNSKWYDEGELEGAVKMMNSLSAELDTLRPSMLQSGLNVVAHNINRKNHNLAFYEFGKTYSDSSAGFAEQLHLCLYVSGASAPSDWKHKEAAADLFTLKGKVSSLLTQLGLNCIFRQIENPHLAPCLGIYSGKETIGLAGEVNSSAKKKHDIKQPVFYADLVWEKIESLANTKVKYKEIPRFPAAQRDLSLIVEKSVQYADIEEATKKASLQKLRSVELFDVFENEKLGASKKSMAISYTFIDELQTLTDQEMDTMIQTLVGIYEKELKAEIRKQ